MSEQLDFNFDYKQHAVDTVGVPLQQDTNFNLEWAEVYLKPLDVLKINFDDYRTKVLNDLQVTSQVWSLEKALNDLYDSNLRRITIEHQQSDELYLYWTDEQQYDVYIYSIAEG